MALELEADRAYGELRRAIVGAGLLNRAYAYYFWRSSLSFVLFAVGIALPFTLAPSAPALLGSALVIAFGSVQVALIGHDAGHLAICRNARANWVLGSL